MVSLQDFADVKERIKTGKRNQIQALHKFIFQVEGDRGNRQRIREFNGFEFDENDERYIETSSYIDENLSNADLISCCVILGIDYGQQNLKKHVFRNLRKNKLLKEPMNDDDEDVQEDDDEEERPNNNQTMYDDACSVVNSLNINEDAETIISRNGTKSERHNAKDVVGNYTPHFMLNFRDVEESIRPFDGSGTIPIEMWIEEFLETASLMGWNQFQMMIYAKKSLRGLAKLFINGERNLNTWANLETALLDEFGRKMNSAQLHKMLAERTMKSNESLQEYTYKMKDMAARGDIDDCSLIQYIIDGIKDSNSNKAMLYGASSLKEFKAKINTYEIFSQRQKAANTTFAKKNSNDGHQRKQNDSQENNLQIKSRCYKCGNVGHVSSNCRIGLKCFKCNKLGHVAKDCVIKSTEQRSKETNIVIKEDKDETVKKDLMKKEVLIEQRRNTALIDTGSVLNLIKLSCYRKLGEPDMMKPDITIKGFGNTGNLSKPLGKFVTDVGIDGETFKLEFYIVKDDCMSVDVVIGEPICQQAEITISVNGIKIKKLAEAEIMQIRLDDEKFEVDIGKYANKKSKQIIEDIVENYKPEMKKQTNVVMKITLTDETPITVGPRRLPLVERQIVEDQIKKWLDEGIIENSESEFCSPIVLVNKKSGGKRLCVDYRKINQVIVKDRFPLPLIEDQLDRLKNAMWYSTIDLRNGFFHVPIEENSRKYTSFVTHSGQYQFLKVPFGLSNSPAVFQRHINAIFRELTIKGVALPYVDDVIIPAVNEEQALENIKEVLQQCRDYGLNINWEKSHFLKKEIEFLGYLIKDQTISPSPSKREVMMKYPLPKTLKQVESFLGLAGYFRKFIFDFANLAKPLSDLRKKDVKFHMGDIQINSFNTLKERLNESPVLKIFNEMHKTELHTDASADGYGAVLLQEWPEDSKLHPVYYMSKKTTDQEKNYTSYELEILAVIEALKKFRVYLLGIHFKIVTDCNAFAATMNKKDLVTRVARWYLLLQEFDYEIEHRSGSYMKHVDALSRNAVMMINVENILSKIGRAQRNDENLQPIFKILEENESYKEYYIKSKILYKLVNNMELIVIPKAMELELIKNAHDKGHFSTQKTKNLLSDYYIPKIEAKIQKVVENCIECVLVNKKKGKQEGELFPIPKQDVPLHTYHIDHLGPLESTSKLYKHIFVVIDGFTKFCWLYPTKSTTSKEVVTKLQLQSMTFGNPQVIVSDRGTAFTAEEFESYCKEEGIRHHLITTGLPRANGQVERINSVIIAVLAKLSIDEPEKWYKYVAKVQQYINCTYQRSINTTPFEILIGTKMRCKEDLPVKEMIEKEMIDQHDEMRNQLRNKAKQEILKVQEENKCRYNLRRKQATIYKIGDIVAIKRTQFGGGLKLKPKFLGPYIVTKVKPKNTYDVTKMGNSEGPIKTSSCAEFMKIWPSEQLDAFGAKA